MSTPRLLFLYPRFFRTNCGQALTSSGDTFGPASRPARRAAFSSSSRRGIPQTQPHQRYGSANEPPPHLDDKGTASPSPPQDPKQKSLPPPNATEQETRTTTAIGNDQAKPPSPKAPNEPGNPIPTPAPDDASRPSTDPAPEPPPSAADASNALSTILRMEPPMSEKTNDEEKPPHLQPPPYVHHFDTYTLVNALQNDKAFTPAQSVTIMKAVRGLLASNMDLARDGLVSKGDAEMASYQFRAASSELRTEMRQRRSAATERMRAERTQLQHEVDTIAQRLTQESLNLRDELKGMFDDRKMAVRMERRTADAQIQELGYKITVAMNSGMRNEVEGLRFILTRRTVLALVGVVVMSLAALRLATYNRAKEEKKAKTATGHGGDEGGEPGSGKGLSDAELALRLEQGADPSLVTMG